jgi:hypothetical protein
MTAAAQWMTLLWKTMGKQRRRRLPPWLHCEFGMKQRQAAHAVPPMLLASPSCSSRGKDSSSKGSQRCESHAVWSPCRRGITAGTQLTPEEQHQLYCQLRLLRLLGALPAAASLEAADLSRLARAVEIEGELKQAREQANNLEGWRRADAGLRKRCEECPVVEAEEGGWRWGRHCAFCLHKRCGHKAAVCCSYCHRMRSSLGKQARRPSAEQWPLAAPQAAATAAQSAARSLLAPACHTQPACLCASRRPQEQEDSHARALLQGQAQQRGLAGAPAHAAGAAAAGEGHGAEAQCGEARLLVLTVGQHGSMCCAGGRIKLPEVVSLLRACYC